MSDETKDLNEDEAVEETAEASDTLSEEEAVEVEPEEVPDPLELLAAERDEFKDKWLRAVAEQDNVRKRARRETTDARRFAVADLMRDLLEVLDNFERATASAEGAEEDDARAGALRSGLDLIHGRFREILVARGLEPVPAETGQVFDPNIHEAVMRMESAEVDSGAVVEVAQPGYRLDDLVIRPARVVVAE